MFVSPGSLASVGRIAGLILPIAVQRPLWPCTQLELVLALWFRNIYIHFMVSGDPATGTVYKNCPTNKIYPVPSDPASLIMTQFGCNNSCEVPLKFVWCALTEVFSEPNLHAVLHMRQRIKYFFFCVKVSDKWTRPSWLSWLSLVRKALQVQPLLTRLAGGWHRHRTRTKRKGVWMDKPCCRYEPHTLECYWFNNGRMWQQC